MIWKKYILSVIFEAAGDGFIVNQLRQENGGVNRTSVIVWEAILNGTREISKMKRVNRDLIKCVQVKYGRWKNIS